MERITVLDGGMGKELRRIGAPFRQPEWSAAALIEAPDRVLEAHRNFVDAGAEVLITNNYAVVPYHLGADVIAERGTELTALAGRLAREAADGAGRPVLVAGSLPPCAETLRTPGLLAGLFKPGAHTFDVLLAFDDGTVVTDSVVWEVLLNTEP